MKILTSLAILFTWLQCYPQGVEQKIIETKTQFTKKMDKAFCEAFADNDAETIKEYLMPELIKEIRKNDKFSKRWRNGLDGKYSNPLRGKAIIVMSNVSASNVDKINMLDKIKGDIKSNTKRIADKIDNLIKLDAVPWSSISEAITFIEEEISKMEDAGAWNDYKEKELLIISHLDPIAKEHEEFAAALEEVNNISNARDMLVSRY